MQVTQINTSRSYLQRTMQYQTSQVAQELHSGKRSVFSNPSDIVIGEMNNSKQILYNSSMQGIANVTTLLNTTSEYLREMSHTLTELKNLFTQASTQNLPQSTLAKLDIQFQEQLKTLDQIASNAKVGSFTPLNGSISGANPLNIHTPSGDVIPISVQDMTNANSPIAKPADGDLQIEFPANIADFQAAIPVDAAGTRINVLDSIKSFCGQNSLLYVIAKQIIIGLGAGNDVASCIAHLQSRSWDTLLPSSKTIAAAQALTNPPSPFIGTINDVVGLALGASQDEILYDIINEGLLAGTIPNEYIVKASNMLSISSPDYFPVVAQRLQSTNMYILSAQNSVNQQIQVLNGLKSRYEAASDMHSEATDKYLSTDMLESTLKLRQLMGSMSFVIDATTGFHAKVTKTISDTVMRILNQN